MCLVGHTCIGEFKLVPILPRSDQYFETLNVIRLFCKITQTRFKFRLLILFFSAVDLRCQQTTDEDQGFSDGECVFSYVRRSAQRQNLVIEMQFCKDLFITPHGWADAVFSDGYLYELRTVWLTSFSS